MSASRREMLLVGVYVSVKSSVSNSNSTCSRGHEKPGAELFTYCIHSDSFTAHTRRHNYECVKWSMLFFYLCGRLGKNINVGFSVGNMRARAVKSVRR